VPLPAAEPGLVVAYEYLWRRRAGTRIAEKARPCCVVAIYFQDEPDEADPGGPAVTKAVYLPISHSPPGADQTAHELTAHAKSVAGLDAARQWVVVSECNLDTWPADLRPLPGRPGRFHYGYLPPAEFERIKAKFLAHVRTKRLKTVRRV
jgi:hypothetical protein